MSEEIPWSGSAPNCLRCGQEMQGNEKVNHPGGSCRIEVYACPCGRKAVIMFELAGGLSVEEDDWVQREVARRGAFFPSDFSGGGQGRFGR